MGSVLNYNIIRCYAQIVRRACVLVKRKRCYCSRCAIGKAVAEIASNNTEPNTLEDRIAMIPKMSIRIGMNMCLIMFFLCWD